MEPIRIIVQNRENFQNTVPSKYIRYQRNFFSNLVNFHLLDIFFSFYCPVGRMHE